jgi:hypothetical protein
LRLKAQRVLEATPVLAIIINEKRPMPSLAKFRLARLHTKLLPEFMVLRQQYLAMCKAYEAPPSLSELEDPNYKQPSTAPPGREAEFLQEWGKISAEEIEVDVEPLALSAFDMGPAVNGPLEAAEIVYLGELLTE